MPPREMRLPDGARDGPFKDEAVELARIWWIRDRPEFVLSSSLKDPKNVGRMLYEAAFHFSNVYASDGRGEQAELLEQIKAGWQDGQSIQMATHMTRDAPPKKG